MGAAWNATDRSARLIEIISPAGFEGYVREVGALLAEGGPPDVDVLMEIAGRYGLTLHLERVPAVMEAHQMALQ